MYVLDTNTLIFYLKGMGNVAERFLATQPKDIAIPSITVFELQVGIAKSNAPKKRSGQLAGLLAVANVLPFGAAEAGIASQIKATLDQQGLPIGPFDLLIAATALANSGTLVTHNLKEFRRVPNLRLEDWY